MRASRTVSVLNGLVGISDNSRRSSLPSSTWECPPIPRFDPRACCRNSVPFFLSPLFPLILTDPSDLPVFFAFYAFLPCPYLEMGDHHGCLSPQHFVGGFIFVHGFLIFSVGRMLAKFYFPCDPSATRCCNRRDLRLFFFWAVFVLTATSMCRARRHPQCPDIYPVSVPDV